MLKNLYSLKHHMPTGCGGTEKHLTWDFVVQSVIFIEKNVWVRYFLQEVFDKSMDLRVVLDTVSLVLVGEPFVLARRPFRGHDIELCAVSWLIEHVVVDGYSAIHGPLFGPYCSDSGQNIQRTLRPSSG
jgi:hypothetical protein